MWRGERSSWRCTINGGCWGITSVHRGITLVHRGITKVHSGAARGRRHRVMNPIHVAFIKGLGDTGNLGFEIIMKYRLGHLLLCLNAFDNCLGWAGPPDPPSPVVGRLKSRLGSRTTLP